MQLLFNIRINRINRNCPAIHGMQLSKTLAVSSAQT